VFGAIQMFILLVHSIQPIQSQPKYIVITQATKIFFQASLVCKNTSSES
jgi:hypothetical protein